jgi:hypothetical protein
VDIATGYGLEIMTGVRGPGEISGYSDWLRAGDYDSNKRTGIVQWV